jgi:hypothetical protein
VSVSCLVMHGDAHTKAADNVLTMQLLTIEGRHKLLRDGTALLSISCCLALTCTVASKACSWPTLVHAVCVVRQAGSAADASVWGANDSCGLVDWGAGCIHQLLAGWRAAEWGLTKVCCQAAVQSTWCELCWFAGMEQDCSQHRGIVYVGSWSMSACSRQRLASCCATTQCSSTHLPVQL